MFTYLCVCVFMYLCVVDVLMHLCIVVFVYLWICVFVQYKCGRAHVLSVCEFVFLL